ncbi:MAG: YbjN domain-containing protein [Alphaproteobacteria bacterium]
MTSSLDELETSMNNPIDMIETALDEQNWPVERLCADELSITVMGDWCEHNLSVSWKDDMETLHLACAFRLIEDGVSLPKDALPNVYELLSRVNEQLLLGHFDLWREEETVVFRHGVLLHAGGTSAEQWECLLQIAVETCERFYPAFHLLMQTDLSPADALTASMFETFGEA